MTVELVATCWTHAGVSRAVNGAVVSPLDIRYRAEAVAAAGFTGIGFTWEDLVAAQEYLTWPELDKICRDLGLVHNEVELLNDWWTSGERRERSDRTRTLLLRAAAELGARHIKIAPDVHFDPTQPAPPPVEIGHWSAELHQLAIDAEAAGTRVALEVLPMSNIDDFSAAAALVIAADHPAAGLAVDIWHLERGPSTLDDLTGIPGGQVFCVELNDARAEQVGDLYYDTIHHRKLCGAGDFDVRGFIRTLQGVGFAGPWGVEIISDEHQARPPAQSLPDVYRTTQAQFS